MMTRFVALLIAGSSLACSHVTAVEDIAAPVLVIVGHPPALPPVPEPPPPPPPPPPPKAVLEETMIRLDEPVGFGPKDAELMPEAYAVLDEAAAILVEAPWLAKIEIRVHTDTIGSKGTNKTLSKQRAAAVRDYLVEKGIEKRRMALGAMGESQPLLTDESEAAQAANRRVEILIVRREPAPEAPSPGPEEEKTP